MPPVEEEEPPVEEEEPPEVPPTEGGQGNGRAILTGAAAVIAAGLALGMAAGEIDEMMQALHPILHILYAQTVLIYNLCGLLPLYERAMSQLQYQQ